MRALLEWFCQQCRCDEPDPKDFRTKRLAEVLDGLDDEKALAEALDGLPFPKARSYWLEEVETGSFLMSGSAGWRIVRGKGGRSWRVYSYSSDYYPEKFADLGDYDSDYIRDEAETAGYRLTLLEWIAMGWRPGSKARRD